MKKNFLLIIMTVTLCACSEPHKDFCADAASRLCSRCEQCGDYGACGLTHTDNRDECISRLMQVCAAYDSRYSPETARTCLEQIDGIPSCDAFKASGKPEICSKLF